MQPVNDILMQIENEIADYKSIKLSKKETGRPVIGWLPTDVPEELIHGAGALPVGIVNTGKNGDLGSSFIPDYICSMVKGALDVALSGKLNFLDGLIIPHVCDSLSQLSGVWNNHAPLPYIRGMLFPVQYTSKSANKFFKNELEDLKLSLKESFDLQTTNDNLMASIELYNSNRQLLREILLLRLSNHGILGNKNYYRVIMSSMLMPKERNNELLADLITAMKNEVETNAPAYQNKKTMFVSGMYYADSGLFDLLDELGIIVVGDDLSVGERYFAVDADLAPGNDPLNALVSRQMQNIPYAGYEQGTDRGSFLTGLMRERQAQGIIFLHLKFCEQENFDYPLLKKAMDELKIPNLRLEISYPLSLGMVRNRLEAMLEIMEGI